MRSKIFQRVLDNTPPEVGIFVRLYADIVLRVNELLEEKGMNQQELARQMDKRPSEISKWLNGEHNLTLKSIAKLEAELGGVILAVPQKKVHALKIVDFQPVSVVIPIQQKVVITQEWKTTNITSELLENVG